MVQSSQSPRFSDQRRQSIKRKEERVSIRFRRPNPDRTQPISDFRTREEKAADKLLEPPKWRCPIHGVLADVIVLDKFLYCPELDCESQVLLVRALSVRRDGRQAKSWNVM